MLADSVNNSPTRRSTPSLVDIPPPKRKSILKKDQQHREESENLLASNRRNVFYGVNKSGPISKSLDYSDSVHTDTLNAQTGLNSLNDNFCTTADPTPTISPTAIKNNNTEQTTNTGNVDNNMHQPQIAQDSSPKKQTSSDSYTDDSQMNTFDKSEDDILFSDSVALSAFNTGKPNIWHNTDIHGIITWQTDTSPSDNLDNDENFFPSTSHMNTPSEEQEPNNGFHISSSPSPVSPENGNHRPASTASDNNNFDCGGDFGGSRSNSRIIPLEQIMQRMQRTSSCDGSPTIPSPGASG